MFSAIAGKHAFLFQKLSEIPNAVEHCIIGIMEACRTIPSDKALKENILVFNKVIHLLKTDFLRILVGLVIDIARHVPGDHIVRIHKRQKVAAMRMRKVSET